MLVEACIKKTVLHYISLCYLMRNDLSRLLINFQLPILGVYEVMVCFVAMSVPCLQGYDVRQLYAYVWQHKKPLYFDIKTKTPKVNVNSRFWRMEQKMSMNWNTTSELRRKEIRSWKFSFDASWFCFTDIWGHCGKVHAYHFVCGRLCALSQCTPTPSQHPLRSHDPSREPCQGASWSPLLADTVLCFVRYSRQGRAERQLRS